ncbi:MAG: hypothetical protein ABSH08_03855 [Tepidisphaeraceae bacterium]|jgi:protein tyrosine phosphatase (PTP) superfamily phosphohydrolase (DUF442 family)
MNAPDADIRELAARRRNLSWIGWAAGVAVLSGLAIWYVCDNAGRWKDRWVPRKLRTVDAGQVYASGQIDRHLIRQVLTDDHISVIVSLIADDPADPDVAAEIQTASGLGIQRYIDPLMGDGTGDIHAYADAIAQIVRARKQGKTVLVHCSSGAQRSNGATFYYRVLVEHGNADEAAQEMKRNGHDSRSNPALIPYLNSHMSEMAKLLVESGTIDRVPDPLPQIHAE